MNSNPKFRHIIITGASSGIGEALALYYAAPGVRLGLTGRNEGRLNKVADACRIKGAEVVAIGLDVADRQGMKEWLEHMDNECPVDLLIANAGISGGTSGVMSGEDPAQVRLIFDVNVNGVFNSVEPVLPRMMVRGRGYIALVSSMAGFRGWPGAPAYCASKAAVKVYGEGLRCAVARTGVKIHVICPGFVESRMTGANDFFMPFLISAERAASLIARGIERNKGRIAFPWPIYALVWLVSLLPDRLASRLLRKLPSKRALM